MVVLISRRMPKLQEVSRYIIESWDSRFHCVLWKERSSLSYVGQMIDAWCPSIGYIQGSEMRHKGVPIVSCMSLQ